MKQQEQSAGDQPEFANNTGASQYEMRIGGKVAALAQYRVEGDAVRFTHTEVMPEHEGQGLGSRIAAHALDDVKSRGMKAVPQCQFIAKYLAKHEKEYGELVQR
jgi:predicted GNAT family acetyltransferase